MRQTVVMYGPAGRGGDPARQGPPGYHQPAYNQPVYYQPAYYPYPYYYGPPVNPYEAARQAEGADQIASIIWKLVLAVVVCAVVGVIALALMLA